MIDGFREDVRTGRQQMARDKEGGALLVPAFNENAGFVDRQRHVQRSDALFDQRYESW